MAFTEQQRNEILTEFRQYSLPFLIWKRDLNIRGTQQEIDVGAPPESVAESKTVTDLYNQVIAERTAGAPKTANVDESLGKEAVVTWSNGVIVPPPISPPVEYFVEDDPGPPVEYPIDDGPINMPVEYPIDDGPINMPVEYPIDDGPIDMPVPYPDPINPPVVYPINGDPIGLPIDYGVPINPPVEYPIDDGPINMPVPYPDPINPPVVVYPDPINPPIEVIPPAAVATEDFITKIQELLKNPLVLLGGGVLILMLLSNRK